MVLQYGSASRRSLRLMTEGNTPNRPTQKHVIIDVSFFDSYDISGMPRNLQLHLDAMASLEIRAGQPDTRLPMSMFRLLSRQHPPRMKWSTFRLSLHLPCPSYSENPSLLLSISIMAFRGSARTHHRIYGAFV